jgi:hypothetical protein
MPSAYYSSKIHTSAGALLSISNSYPATYDQTGFTALTFIPVHEISDMGEFGLEYKEVNHMSLDTRTTTKRKGSYDAGTMQLVLGKVASDPGQAAIIAARDSDSSFAFQVYFPQDGTIVYFSAQVMSYKTKVGGVDSILTAITKLAIDQPPIEIPGS